MTLDCWSQGEVWRVISEVANPHRPDNLMAKEQGQKDHKWSTKHCIKTKYWATRTPQKKRVSGFNLYY